MRSLFSWTEWPYGIRTGLLDVVIVSSFEHWIKVPRIIAMFWMYFKDRSSLVCIFLGLVWPWIYHSLWTTLNHNISCFNGVLWTIRAHCHLLQSKCFIILPKGNYIDSFYVAISLWIVNNVLGFHDLQVYFGINVRPVLLPEWEGYFIHPSDIRVHLFLHRIDQNIRQTFILLLLFFLHNLLSKKRVLPFILLTCLSDSLL